MTLVLESRMPGNWPVRFGGGESEKDQQWHLVGFLSYAKIEIAILERNALSLRLEDEETVRHRVLAVEAERNVHQRGIAWQFTSRDARHKLERLYPVKEPMRMASQAV